MPERHTKLLEIDVARLGSGSVVEASCRLLPDKDVSDLRSDSESISPIRSAIIMAGRHRRLIFGI